MSRFEEKVLELKAKTALRVAEAKQRLMYNGRPTSYQRVEQLATPQSSYDSVLDSAISSDSLMQAGETAVQIEDPLSRQLPSPLQQRIAAAIDNDIAN